MMGLANFDKYEDFPNIESESSMFTLHWMIV